MSTGSSSGGIGEAVVRAYEFFRRSVALTVAVIGVLLIVSGATVMPRISEPMAAIFGIWGVVAIVLGLLTYAVLWLNKEFRE